MPAIVTNKFRVHNSEQFHEAFSEAASTNQFIFIGKVSEWLDASSVNIDANPPTPTDTVENTEYNHWDDMILAKRVTSNDVSHVINRYNWTSGTVYDQFDSQDSSLYSKPFFVVTEDFNVYKCMYNNHGAQSTVMPSSINTSAGVSETTADGYKWKYMYSISAADALKFITTSFIPVKRLRTNDFTNLGANAGEIADDGSNQWEIENSATDGSIDVVVRNASGNGAGYLFTDAEVTSSALGGATPDLTLDFTNYGGVNPAQDTLAGSWIYVSSSATGQGMLAEISAHNGTTFTLDANTGNLGSQAGDANYQFDLTLALAGGDVVKIGPKVIVNGDGSGALVYATGSNTSGIVDMFVANTGSGYHVANLAVTQTNATITTAADFRPVLSPVGGHGYNMVEELFGFNVMLNVRLEGSESNTFTVSNDFRKIGLVRDPVQSADATQLYVSELADQTTRIKIGSTIASSADYYVADQQVIGSLSGATGFVVDYNNTADANSAGTLGSGSDPQVYPELRVTEITRGGNSTAGFDGVPGSFQIGERIMRVTAGDPNGVATDPVTAANDATSSNVVFEKPDMKKYRGDILYVENRSPVSRASDQVEDIKLIVQF
tara:strand:- start:859 stop:2679 length:1821 start_codon:yes stop_codon:yes gene_type:complete